VQTDAPAEGVQTEEGEQEAPVALGGHVALVPVPPHLETAWPAEGRAQLRPDGIPASRRATVGHMAKRDPDAWKCTPGLARALVEIDTASRAVGLGRLRIVTVRRSVAHQDALHRSFLEWASAGCPEPGTRGYRGMTPVPHRRAADSPLCWGGGVIIDFWGMAYPKRYTGMAWDIQMSLESLFGSIRAAGLVGGGAPDAFNPDLVLWRPGSLVALDDTALLHALARVLTGQAMITGQVKSNNEAAVQARLIAQRAWSGAKDAMAVRLNGKMDAPTRDALVEEGVVSEADRLKVTAAGALGEMIRTGYGSGLLEGL